MVKDLRETVKTKYMIMKPIVYGIKPEEDTTSDQKYRPLKRRNVVKMSSSSSTPLYIANAQQIVTNTDATS